MYLSILLFLSSVAALAFRRGIRARSRLTMIFAGALAAATALFFATLDLWGEWLWFKSLGFSGRFWTVLTTQVGLSLTAALAAALLVGLVTAPAARASKLSRYWPSIGAGLAGALWGAASWGEILLWRHGPTTELSEPILGRDTGFYLFKLPFYDRVFVLLVLVALFSLLGSAASLLGRSRNRKLSVQTRIGPDQILSLRLCFGWILTLLGFGAWLEIYHLLYSDWGAVSGPGWTDVHFRLPGFQVGAALLWFFGALFLAASLFPRLGKVPVLSRLSGKGAMATLVVALATGLGLLPVLVQRFAVEPNEITFEKPFIAHNIRFTRLGFQLDKADEREFPVSATFSPSTLDKNRELISEIRLWDWRALKAVHKQFQEIRLYYEFDDVDIDRYRLGGGYHQVMVSAREMEQRNLPEQSRTFVNRRFKYTHGYGLTMTPVSEFTDEGLPNFLIKDIPPQSSKPELEIGRPAIYYGELTREHVFVNTSEEEFDYPRGDQNVYTRYAGRGGVELNGLWEKFLFGWKFDGSKFFLSTYPGKGSRVLFHRQVRERVHTVAPFLEFDEDPYIVTSEGKLYWIIDGFTFSKYFPYSEPFSSKEVIEYTEGATPRSVRGRVNSHLNGANYVRNSVKAVVDAYDGTVDLYVFEPADPLIQAWEKIFPDLFKAESEMPSSLRQHVRYPADFLLTQGMVYAKYHMGDPEVFYNQEDLWVRATEKYYSGVQPVEPYYVMWELPDSNRSEFTLILPFTPKNRQVLIGWMAGLCDGDNYGRLLTYKFPKEKTVLGPQQMETKIDQDRFLSGQLTLWDQRGSRVIRGNVLAIPIEDTLLYVEPIYLQAETAAYPELRLVTVMHGDNLSYAPSLAEALQGLFRKSAPAPAGAPTEDLAKAANQAFDSYLRLQGEGRFEEAAQELSRLRETLRKMLEEGAETQPQ